MGNPKQLREELEAERKAFLKTIDTHIEVIKKAMDKYDELFNIDIDEKENNFDHASP